MAVTAIPPGSSTLTPPPLAEGRWLAPGETGAAVLSQNARAATIPDLRAGDTIQLSIGGRPTSWRVVGIADELFVGTGVYVTTEGFSAATGRLPQPNLLRVVTDQHDEETRATVASTTEQVLTNASVKVRPRPRSAEWRPPAPATCSR